jgi:hypothetical protein
MTKQVNHTRRANVTEVEFKLARSRDELFEAFSLVYRSYFRAGLSDENPSQIRLTPYHFLDTSEVLVARLRGVVISTLSLFGDGQLGLPMQSMYPDEIAKLRAEGRRIAEVGSFADRREKQVRFIDNLQNMGRLLGQTAKENGYDTLVAVVHPRHARLYKRVLGFKQIGNETYCPYANDNPAEALCLKFESYLGTEYQERYFDDRLDPELLQPYSWDNETKRFFGQILHADERIAEIIGMPKPYEWELPQSDATSSTETATACDSQV